MYAETTTLEYYVNDDVTLVFNIYRYAHGLVIHSVAMKNAKTGAIDRSTIKDFNGGVNNRRLDQMANVRSIDYAVEQIIKPHFDGEIPIRYFRDFAMDRYLEKEKQKTSQ